MLEQVRKLGPARAAPALLGVLALLALGTWWLLRAPPPEPPRHAAAERPPPGEALAPAPAMEPGEALASAPRRVRLESSAGVPLTDARLELEDGQVVPVSVATPGEDFAGRDPIGARLALEVELPAGARRGLAAGHHAFELDGERSGSDAPTSATGPTGDRAEILALEPVALLELVSPVGRELSVELSELESAAASHGWSAPATWALAVDREDAAPLELVAHTGPWSSVALEFHTESGQRARVELPAPPPTAPLRVELVHSLGRPAGPTGVRVAETGPPPVPVERSEPWGSWTATVQSAAGGRRWAPGSARELDLGPLPLGAALRLQGRDEATGAWARVDFVHDGSPRRLELRGGLVIRGRVQGRDVGQVGGRDGPGARGPRAVIRGRVRGGLLHGDGRELGPDEELLWRAEASLNADGSFQLTLPARLPEEGAEGAEAQRPRSLRLEVEAEGYADAARTLGPVAVGDELVVLGEAWWLEPLPPGVALRLRLAPGLDLTGARSLRRMEGGALRQRPVVATPGGDSLDLGPLDPRPGEEAPWPPVEPSAQAGPGDARDVALVDFGADRSVRALEERDGLWRAVPRARRDVAITVDGLPGSAGSRWSVGWRWHGLEQPLLDLDEEDVGVRTTLAIDVPRTAAELWWRPVGEAHTAGSATPGQETTEPESAESERAALGGALPLRGATTLLRLPPRSAGRD